MFELRDLFEIYDADAIRLVVPIPPGAFVAQVGICAKPILGCGASEGGGGVDGYASLGASFKTLLLAALGETLSRQIERVAPA